MESKVALCPYREQKTPHLYDNSRCLNISPGNDSKTEGCHFLSFQNVP